MSASYQFHPDALLEYADAAFHYLHEAPIEVADQFTMAVETAVATLVAEPTKWRIVEDPEIRRYVLQRFPFVIYYRWETRHQRVTIYAVMHSSRQPGYWRHRVEPSV